MATFLLDSPGTIRRSIYTGMFLIRAIPGWIALDANKEWGHHYSDIGAWDGDEDRWPLYPVQKVG